MAIGTIGVLLPLPHIESDYGVYDFYFSMSIETKVTEFQ